MADLDSVKKILHSDRGLAAKEISSVLDVSRSTLTKRLKKWRESGQIRYAALKNGSFIYYADASTEETKEEAPTPQESASPETSSTDRTPIPLHEITREGVPESVVFGVLRAFRVIALPKLSYHNIRQGSGLGFDPVTGRSLVTKAHVYRLVKLEVLELASNGHSYRYRLRRRVLLPQEELAS